MKAASATLVLEQNSYSAIFYGGLIAGSMDITAAFVFYGWTRGGTAVGVLQSVASGLLGAASYDGGLQSAALGLFFQFFIATTAAAVYFLIGTRLGILKRHPIPFGCLYGIVVYYFMGFVVVPLSAFPHPLIFTARGMITGLLIHIFCVGLPIGLTYRRFAQGFAES